MGRLLMQGPIFFVLLELAHCQNGSMTISSSGYYVNTSQHTTKSIKNGMDISLQMVAGYKMVVGSSSKEKPCQMGMSWSLTKMSAPFSEISQQSHLALNMRHVSPIMMQILIAYQKFWAFHGKT